jgi:dinuclear metal center YbgI/SA1388 family protein
MNVGELVAVMQQIAPLRYAESWDRAGLQVGSSDAMVSGPVMLTIDLSERVLDEAVDKGASAIIAYHCPIWNPLATLTDGTPKERVIRRAIEEGMAIFSPHTALDSAPDGVTDWLCEGISGGQTGTISGDCRALEPHHATEREQQMKVVVFVPEAEADALRNAMATAGAGTIGSYRLVSFGAPGVGTFYGTEGTTPAVGQTGRLERVAEVRLEMVCSRAALPLVERTLCEFHPYETPAYDVYELYGTHEREAGLGRRLVLDQPATIDEIAHRLARHIGTTRVKYALAGDDEPVRQIGVIPGSGEDLAELAAREGCRVFVTGEMRHHSVIQALEQGLSVVLGGHTNTERGYLPRLAERIKALAPELDPVVSRCDCDRFHMVKR